MKPGVKVLGEDGEVVAEFYSVKRKDDKLIIDGKALGVMRMDMILTSEELVKGARIFFSWGILSYIALIPYFLLRTAFRRIPGVSPRRSQGGNGSA